MERNIASANYLNLKKCIFFFLADFLILLRYLGIITRREKATKCKTIDSRKKLLNQKHPLQYSSDLEAFSNSPQTPNISAASEIITDEEDRKITNYIMQQFGRIQ